MSISALILIAAVLGLAIAVYLHPERRLVDALAVSRRQAVQLIPIVIPAILAAGFIAELLPGEAISRWVGPESGFAGAMLAAGFGCILPTGPMVILPVAAALLQADAGTGQILALINGWSLMNVQRLVLYDFSLAGVPITVRRFCAGIAMTPVAALLGLAVVG